MRVRLYDLHEIRREVARAVSWKSLPRLAASEFGGSRVRTRFSRKNPIVAGLHEIINQPIYDSFSLAANTAFAPVVLFQSPVGTGGKTLWDTYMRLNGILQAPQKFLIRAFRLHFRNDAAPVDAIALLNSTWLNFVINQKPYFYGPSFLWTAGGGPYGFLTQVGTAPAGTAVTGFTSNGLPVQQNVLGLSRPIQLEQNENFFLEVNQGAAFTTALATANPVGTGLRVYALLDGELSRGVQ